MNAPYARSIITPAGWDGKKVGKDLSRLAGAGLA